MNLTDTELLEVRKFALSEALVSHRHYGHEPGDTVIGTAKKFEAFLTREDQPKGTTNAES